MFARILDEGAETLRRVIEESGLTGSEAEDRFQQCEVALKEAIGNRSPVAELQLLGLDTRRINQLEDSEYGIVTIDNLLCYTPKELLEISWLGKQGVDSIYTCLSLYHTLPAIREQLEPGCYEGRNSEQAG